jgi:pyruvate formate lyase activating enzyme
MKIGGLQKVSLIDYPGRISAVVFTQGCNFRCPYCHNPELVDPQRFGPLIPEAEVLDFLERRRGKLEAVSVTGGEPLLQNALAPFLSRLKSMGYLVKVDTNGSLPGPLAELIRLRVVDYLAMDIKGPLSKYAKLVAAPVDPARIAQSIALIRESGIAHEFRTTLVRSQLDFEDLLSAAHLISGAPRYVLQPFVPSKLLDEGLRSEIPYSTEELYPLRDEVEKIVLHCEFR